MTMTSRSPHQIVGYDLKFDKSPERIQAIVDIFTVEGINADLPFSVLDFI